MAKKQTFLDSPTEKDIRHLNIVITDANSEREYLVVPVDSLKYRYQDRSCVLHPGDHPFIKHESFVNYKYAQVISFVQLFNGLQKGLFIKKEDISEEVLRRIQAGARKTLHLRTEFKAWFDLF